MGWLKLSFGKGGTAVAERETAESAPQAPSGPPIIVLVNDAAGRAAFKEYVFYDVETATDWVSYWFPHQTEDGMIAFWAMPDQPGSGLAEPLVIIRDLDRHGVVYMFSFANLTAAEEFIAQETEHGTDADSMVLYWAVPVKREFDHLGKLFLTPSTPPDSSDYEDLLSIEVDSQGERQEPPLSNSSNEVRPVEFEEAANARTGVARPMGGAEETFELTSWVNRSRKRESAEREAHSEPMEALIDRDEPARSVEAEIDQVLADLEAVLEDADGGMQIDAPLSDPTNGQLVELTADGEVLAQAAEVEELTIIDGPTSEPPQIEVVTTEVEAFGEPFGDEPVTVDTAALAEPVEVEETSNPTEIGAESFVDEMVITDNAALAEPVEAEAFNGASETPAERRDDEFGPADEPDVPDYELPEHVVSPTSVNGNGHAHDVTSSLWERAEEIAGSVQHGALETDVSSEEVKKTVNEALEWDATEEAGGFAQYHARENGVSNEAGKKTIDEVLVNVNVNVNVSDGVRTDVSIDGPNISIRSRALKIKRWEVREEPFEGFNSPPGRF